MSITVETLLELRHQTLSEYLDGQLSKGTCRADLDAIAVEVDRLLSPDGWTSIEERAARVVTEIIADSQGRSVAVVPAKAARLEFWRRRRIDHLRRENPQDHEADRKESALNSDEADEVRMVPPILAALADESIAGSAAARVRAIAEKPRGEADPSRVPPSPDVVWVDADRLSWEEFIAGVPCQGCGRAFMGDEAGQRKDEPWPVYRERIKPVEAAFRAGHPDHGTSWTVGGGPNHCRRCCPPHPLSPEQIKRINQILNPPTPALPKEAPVRRCTTCRKSTERDHVCQLEDLPKDLRAVVEAVLERERGQES